MYNQKNITRQITNNYMYVCNNRMFKKISKLMLCPDSGASSFNDAFVKTQRNVQSLCEGDQ